MDERTLTRFASPALLLAALAPSPAAPAQLVDDGAFRLFVDDREVGVEEFTIQRVGSGTTQRTFARGTLSMHDGRQLRTVMQAVGPEMTLAAYQIALTGADTATAELVNTGDRLRITILEPDGERVREYRADPETFVLEQGIAHHYFVLGRLAEAGVAEASAHVVAPLADEPPAAAALAVGPHTLETDDGALETTRVLVRSEGNARTAWFDGSGRLVRVEARTGAFVAVRVR